MAKPASKVRAEEYRNYIGGKWVAPSSGRCVENRSPADTRDLVGRFPASTSEDVDRAVMAAPDALTSSRKTPAPRRAEILFKVGEILIRRKEEFALANTPEMAKVIKET